MMVPEYLGQILVTGEEMHAASASDLYFRWRPGAHAFFMRVHHPLPNMDVEASPEAELGGYPVVSSPAGVVVGDDTTYRFLTAINGFPTTGWHRDVPWSLGIPALDGGLLFMGAGGVGATQGLIALDAATGSPRWAYAPGGLDGDPLQIAQRRVRKTITWKDSPSADAAMMEVLQAVAKSRAPTPPTTPGSNAPARTIGGRSQFTPTNTRVDDALRRIQYGANGRPADEATYYKTLFGTAPGPVSRLPHGHWSNPGAITLGGAVYAEVAGNVVALDQANGSPLWQYLLAPKSFVTSMVASPDELFCCIATPKAGRREPVWTGLMADGESHLVALNLKTGKKDWDFRLQRPGVLSMSGGILYLSDGDLHAFGPAERTFQMAVDTDRPADYRQPGADEAQNPAAPGKPESQSVADASILRLAADLNPAEISRRVQARTQAIGSAPLSVSLDWLDETRARRRRGGDQPWSDAEIQEFARQAGQVAAQAHPEHFDVAPEVNAYLLRHPDQSASVLKLVQAATAAIHTASPRTRVLVSMNVELLNGAYGRGSYLPLGKVQLADRPDRAGMLELVPLVDEVGLTSYPQAALRRGESLPPDYLLAMQSLFKEKPLVVTRIAVRTDPREDRDGSTQAALVRTMLQECYWLNASLVAYPDLLAGETQPQGADVALRLAEQSRPALEAWRETGRFQRVDRLSTGSPSLNLGAKPMAYAPAVVR